MTYLKNYLPYLIEPDKIIDSFIKYVMINMVNENSNKKREFIIDLTRKIEINKLKEIFCSRILLRNKILNYDYAKFIYEILKAIFNKPDNIEILSLLVKEWSSNEYIKFAHEYNQKCIFYLLLNTILRFN